MAGNTVSIELKVQDTSGSLKARTKEAKTLNAELEKMPTGTKTGGGAYRASYMAANKESEEYGRARGSYGTGAAGRDFANQAQGLGGLVRLYATYAANLFAVGAAFRGLSSAMDTANMVKGLDQLGASSGVALGSLSKRLVEATDGAVSLREAMEATVKASSSGMSSENILRMGEVAKQASMALGVDMSDALSRISRGITKLEPELLDEIGIFTRLDPAVKAYAKEMGKAVGQVTDFERRMAFANAVLAEGEKKFGEIKMDANPYTKLLASIKDLAQVGGELINKFIAPVIGYLSQSPAALGTAIAALVGILVKQALPAFGEFKAGLAASADKALELSVTKAQDATDALGKIRKLDQLNLEKGFEQQLAIVDKAQEKILSVRTKAIKKGSALDKVINEQDINSIAEKDLKNIDRQATVLRSQAKKASSVEITTALNAEADAYTNLTKSIRTTIAQNNDINAQTLAHATSLEKNSGRFSAYSLTLKAAKTAEENATKSAIVSNAAYNASLVGVSNSFRLMKEEIKDSGLALGNFGKAALYAKGGLAILGGYASTLINSLGGLMQIIGLFIAAFSMLDGVLSKADKENQAFSDSLKRVEGAANTATDSIERMYKGSVFSLDSMQAQANATLELSDSMEQLVKSANKAATAINASPWDKLKDNVASIFGGGVQNNFSKALIDQVSTAVEELESGPIKTKLAESLSDLLNVKDVGNFKEIEKALDNLDPKSDIVKKISKLLKDAGMQAGIAASKAKEFSDSFDKSTDSFKALGKSYEIKSPIVTWATDSLDSILKLRNSLEGPLEESLANLTKLTSKVNENPLFGYKASLNISKYGEEMAETYKTINKTAEAIRNLRAEQDAASAAYAAGQLKVNTAVTERQIYGGGVREAETTGKNELAQLKLALDQVTAKGEKLQGEYAKAMAEAQRVANEVKKNISLGIINSVSLVEKGIASALAKGSTEALQSIYGMIDNIPELAGRQEELKLQELANDATMIKLNQTLANEIRLATAESAMNTAAIRLQTAQSARLSLEQNVRNGDSKDALVLGAARAEEESAKSNYVAATKAKVAVGMAGSNPRGAMKYMKDELESGNKDIESYTASVIAAAQESTGFIAALNSIGRQASLIKDISIPLAKEKSRGKEIQDNLGDESKKVSNEKDLLELKKQSNSISQEEYITETSRIGLTLSALNYAKEISTISSKYNEQLILEEGLRKQGRNADADMVRSKAESTRLSAEQIAMSSVQNSYSKTELSTQQEILAYNTKLLEQEKERANFITETASIASNQQIESMEAELRFLEAQGTTSENVLQLKKSAIEYAKIEYAQKDKLYKLDIWWLTSVKPLMEEYTKASADPAAQSRIQQQIINLRDRYDVEYSGIQKATAANIEYQDMMGSLTADQRELASTFRQSFEGMTDAIANFAKTGKLDFKSLADSIISDMMRIVIQQQLTKPLSNMLIGALTSAFTGGAMNGGGIDAATGSFSKIVTGGSMRAKGAGYESGGVEFFAKGGQFTNSIVSTPTMFKFAQGTGLMGEAGPEAIMPLKRDNNGNLGVRAASSEAKVNVTVINNSTEKAETRETTDSRGNRSIEVIIGEMVAGEMSKPNSAMQNSMKNTFGAAPVLTRR